MFLISKDGFSVREPKQISMSMECSKEVKAEAQKIYISIIKENMQNKRYSSNEIDDFARKKADEYTKGKNVCSIILDREIDFGTYDEVQGRTVFEKILAALKNGERFFDMREVEFGEDSQCD